MSDVYAAQDINYPNELIAVKLLNIDDTDPLLREIFRREVASLQLLSHPNIVRLLDHGWSEHNKSYFLVLEYLPSNLKDLLDSGYPQSHQDHAWFWPMLRSLADGLAIAHSEGIIHRDIKPSNILLDENNSPKIADFGISRLKYELSAGMTLSDFCSPGYSAPEQLKRGETDTWSDIYSLGAVCYHVLSGSLPPPDGPTIESIELLNIRDDIKSMLAKMLAPNPEDRYKRISELIVDLEKTKSLDVPPWCFVVLSERAKQELADQKGTPALDYPTAFDMLVEEFQGLDVNETYAHLGESDSIYILGNSLRLACSMDNVVGNALRINHINARYGPFLEKEKANSLKVRIDWIFAGRDYIYSTGDSLSASKANIETLYDHLNEHNIVASKEAEHRTRRRQLFEVWEQALNLGKAQIEEKAPILPYDEVTLEKGFVNFHLRQIAPDILNWQDNTPIAILGGEGAHYKFVGTLVEIKGDHAIVYADFSGSSTRSGMNAFSDIPTTGGITVDVTQELASLNRQREALSRFQKAQMANPRLGEVLTDLAKARLEPLNEDITFFQHWLAKDKKEAVIRALSAKDLFFIKGPPGTGKTSVIAEIILQILRNDPDACILLSSQSNVAVNHALSRIAEEGADLKPEMIRLCRPDKIGQGAEEWLMENRLIKWREEVLKRLDTVINQLDEEIQTIRDKQKGTHPDKEGFKEKNIDPLRQWLDEAKYKIDDLDDELAQYEEQLDIDITPNQQHHTNDSSQVSDTNVMLPYQQIQDKIQQKKEDLEKHMNGIRALLPKDAQSQIESDPKLELDRLEAIYTNYVPRDKGDQLYDIRQLLRNWYQAFGRGSEFSNLLIKRARVIGATCLFIKPGNQIFDWAIVDEASRATDPELLVPLVLAKRSILIGDEKQLPPFLDDEYSEENLKRKGMDADEIGQLGISMFQRLVQQVEQTNPKILSLLSTQYRMHTTIGKLISDVFYDGTLLNGNLCGKYDHNLPWVKRSVTWFSTADLGNERHEEQIDNTFANRCEVSIIEQILIRIEQTYRKSNIKKQVGVISGYSGQIKELTSRLEPLNRLKWTCLDIEIATVDSFQGRECDIILYSTVRSNPKGSIGFLRDYRRVNVALSRARQLLIIVGDSFMMEHASIGRISNPFQSVLKHIQAHPDNGIIEKWGKSTLRTT